MKRMVLSGNYAAAYAVKAAKPHVVSAYPITPQTTVIEKISEFVEKGELDAKVIRVESEHSAMASVIGAAAVGARVYTATSSQGLLYMYEMCWWAAGARLPIVMGVVTRAIAPPWSIWTDHSDILTLRDSGWIIMFAASAQEVYDMTLQAYRIAEEQCVSLPVAVAWDAFVVSHTYEPVDILDDEEAKDFIRPREEKSLIDFEDPGSLGNLTYPDTYQEMRYDISRAMDNALSIIRDIDEEFGKKFGRKYGGLVEKYLCGDADYIIFLVGAAGGDARVATNILRRQGVKVGICRIRSIKPFPYKEIIDVCSRAKAIAVLDRSSVFGGKGPLAVNIRAALHESGINIPVLEVVGGLGGRDISVEDFLEIFRLVIKGKKGLIWWGLKGGE